MQSTRCFLAAAALAVGLCAPRSSAAASPLGSIRLLGGERALQTIAFPGDVPRAQVLPLLIRTLAASPFGQDNEIDMRRERLLKLLATLSRVDNITQQWPDGLRLPAPKDTQARRRASDALAVLGLELREQRNAYSVRPDGGSEARAIRDGLNGAGVDVDAVMKQLNAGEPAIITVPVTTLPFPLPRDVWSSVVLERRFDDDDWLADVLRDRRASLLAYGLLETDAETRDWFATTPRALKAALDHPGTFTMLAPAFHLTTGGVEVPGGAEWTAAWESLLDAKTAAPDRFVAALLSQEDGAAAFFFATLARFDARRLAFAVGGVPNKAAALGHLFRAFIDPQAEFKIDERPFTHNSIDGAVILQSLELLPDGGAAGPTWERFWNETLDGDEVPMKSTGPVTSLERGGRVDAAWYLDAVLSRPLAERRRRFELLLLAQRLFPSPRTDETGDMLVTLRGFARFPALVAALERMGARQPGVMAAMVRAAERIGDAAEEVRPIALAQFQGAVAVLVRLATRGERPRAEIEQACVELAALPLDERETYRGAIVEWLDGLVARMAGHAADASVQTALVSLTAGTGGAVKPPFAWESERYIPAPGELLARQMTATLNRSPQSIDRVVALARAIRALRAATTIEGVHAAVTELAAMVNRAQPGTLLHSDREQAALKAARDSVKKLQRLSKPKDVSRVAGASVALVRLLDLQAAGALRDLAYVTFVPSDNATVLDSAARHDFGDTPAVTVDERRRAPWAFPAEESDTGSWHVKGSLLGLDVAVARLALRRLISDLPPPPTIPTVSRILVAETAVLAEPSAFTDDDVRAIVLALARGRDRLQRESLASLRSIPTLSASRREAIEWVRTNDPEHLLAQTTAIDLYQLGASASGVPGEPWGAAQVSSTGCLCIRPPLPIPWEDLATRAGAFAAVSTLDLEVRLAEHLHILAVPAELLPSVLPFAAQDIVDTTTAASEEDLFAVARATSRLTRARVSDYVAAAIGRGAARVVESNPVEAR